MTITPRGWAVITTVSILLWLPLAWFLAIILPFWWTKF